MKSGFFRKNECDDRSDERKKTISIADYPRSSTLSPTHHGWFTKIKMLQAVRVSCPRKFIINNHIFSSYRSLYKAPFFFPLSLSLFSPRFCVYGSHIIFIIASIHLSFVNFCLSKNNNSVSTPSSRSHRRIRKTRFNILHLRPRFLFAEKESQNQRK